MSNDVLTRVWKQSPQKGSALLLTVAIADIVNNKGVGFPGDDYLKDRIRMSRRNTERLIDHLEETGEIYRRIGQGRGNKTFYAVLTGLDKPAIETVLKEHNRYFDLDPDTASSIADSVIEKRRQFVQSKNEKKRKSSELRKSLKKATKNTTKGDIVERKTPITIEPLLINTNTEDSSEHANAVRIASPDSNPNDGSSGAEAEGVDPTVSPVVQVKELEEKKESSAKERKYSIPGGSTIPNVFPLYVEWLTNPDALRTRWQTVAQNYIDSDPKLSSVRCGELAAALLAKRASEEWDMISVIGHTSSYEMISFHDAVMEYSEDISNPPTIREMLIDWSGSRTILLDMAIVLPPQDRVQHAKPVAAAPTPPDVATAPDGWTFDRAVADRLFKTHDVTVPNGYEYRYYLMNAHLVKKGKKQSLCGKYPASYHPNDAGYKVQDGRNLYELVHDCPECERIAAERVAGEKKTLPKAYSNRDVFDAIAEVSFKAIDKPDVDAVAGRVAKIRKKLIEHVLAKRNESDLDETKCKELADYIRKFGAWYDQECVDCDRPASPDSFMTWWIKFVNNKGVSAKAQKANGNGVNESDWVTIEVPGDVPGTKVTRTVHRSELAQYGR